MFQLTGLNLNSLENKPTTTEISLQHHEMFWISNSFSCFLPPQVHWSSWIVAALSLGSGFPGAWVIRPVTWCSFLSLCCWVTSLLLLCLGYSWPIKPIFSFPGFVSHYTVHIIISLKSLLSLFFSFFKFRTSFFKRKYVLFHSISG